MNIDNDKFRQSNDLIKATHKMNNAELKLFFFACTIRNEGDEIIEIPFNAIIKKLGIKDGGNQYKTIEKALEHVVRGSVVAVEMDEDQIAIKPIITAILNKKTRIVKIEFEKLYLFLLDDLKKNYTWMYLQQLAKLDLQYSPRVYEFCKMLLGANLKNRSYIWYIKDLRTFLDIQNKYKDWDNLKRRVLIPSMKEINEKCSDVSFEFRPLKNKAVYGIEMSVWALPHVPKNINKKTEDNVEVWENEIPEYIKNFKWWE